MGMFDDVRCDMPLPEHQDGEFQTKDLECAMSHYRITKDGRLVREKASTFYADGLPLGDVNHHGFLSFYDWWGDDRSSDNWIEYRAKFTDGKCVGIEKVETAS